MPAGRVYSKEKTRRNYEKINGSCDNRCLHICSGEANTTEKPLILTTRLKIENGRIAEAESIVTQGMMGDDLGGAMAVPPTAYTEALAPDERVSREELVKISNLYFDSIEGIKIWFFRKI